MTIKARTKFAVVYPGDNEASTRIQGLHPSSTCIPLQGERRQDDERRHSDLYSRVNPVIYRKLVILRTLDSCRVETQNRLRANQALSLVGYEPNHDELCYKRKCTVRTPSRRSADIYGRDLQGLTEFKASRVDVDKVSGHRRHKAKTVSTRPRGRSLILLVKQTTRD